MTENKNEKYNLVLKGTRELVLMERTGEPFEYSSKEGANRGKRILEAHRKVSLTVVPA